MSYHQVPVVRGAGPDDPGDDTAAYPLIRSASESPAAKAGLFFAHKTLIDRLRAFPAALQPTGET